MINTNSYEYDCLEKTYGESGSRLIVLYASRYVGIHRLIKAFTADKQYSYYLARMCSKKNQLAFFTGELKNRGYNISDEADYGEILSCLLEDEEHNSVIILNEFQNIVKYEDKFPDIIEQFISRETNTLLILASTDVAWIENTMVSKLGASARYISAFIKLRERPYQELAEYFGEYYDMEKIQTYAVLGGASDLWQYFDRFLPLRDNICRYLLSRDSFIYDKAAGTIAASLREPSVYNTIMYHLSTGRNKLNDLHEATGFSRAKLSVYISNLISIDLVEKIFSIETPRGHEESMKGVYRIKNNLVDFYFHFIFSHESDMDLMSPEEFYDAYIEGEIAGYSARYYVKACRDLLDRAALEDERFGPVEKTGEWAGKVGSIDWLARCEDGTCVAAFCNQREGEMTLEDYEWSVFCLKKAGIESGTIILVSEYGYEESLYERSASDENLRLYSIADL